MGEEYKDFQKKIYGCLVDYKERHITRDSGKYKGEENPWFLPEKFWDSTDEKSKGLQGDHSKQAGTDSDVAIAYYNTDDELCLWLIEHKLTEQGFTACGGYKSKGNDEEGKAQCRSCSMEDILNNPDICYYHRGCKYNYWNIMKDGGAEFYVKAYEGKGCPFRGGMNQLWRNQLLAMALEKEGTYKKVYFSVVHHPEKQVRLRLA